MSTNRVTVRTAKPSSGNRYSVPLRQWRKWGAEARRVFNEVYSAMVSNRRLFLHPAIEANPPRREHWKTTAWNAAWTAACALG